MDYWQEFIRFEYANEIMMVVGTLLVFFSALKILRSSLKLLIWVVLASLGAASLSYGVQHSPYDLPALDSLGVADIKALAPKLNKDVLEFLCEKLDGQSQ